MSRPAYKVRREPKVGCNCGKWGQFRLSANESWLPSFYICPACGDVSQVGVGRVGKVRLSPPRTPGRR